MSKSRFDMNLCVGSQMANQGLRLDANETAVFARELEYLQAEAVEAKFPEFKGLTLVPVVGNGIAPGMRSHTYREITGVGEAEMLENHADEDFPTAEVFGAEVTGKFRHIGAKYIVTVEDLRAVASGMSINVDAEKSKLARKVIESKLDKLVADGAPGVFNGLTSDASSTLDDTNVTNAGGSLNWTTATVDQIVATLQAMADAAFSDTNGVFDGLDFAFPTRMWLKLGKRSSTTGSDKTIAEYVMSSVPRIRSMTHWARLDGKGAGGKDRLLAYQRNAEVLDCLLPTRFEQFAPQLSGMAFKTFVTAKYGGLRIKHIKAIRRADVTT